LITYPFLPFNIHLSHSTQPAHTLFPLSIISYHKSRMKRPSRIKAEDVDVDARLGEVPWVLGGVASGLLPHGLLVFQRLVLVELIEGCIGGGVGVDLLVDKVDHALDEVRHAGFALPVLPLQHRHADIAAFVDMHVLEIWLKPELRSHLRVLLGKGNLDGVVSALEERLRGTWDPKDPSSVARKSLRHAFHDLREGQLSDLLQFVLYSALPHAIPLTSQQLLIIRL